MCHLQRIRTAEGYTSWVSEEAASKMTAHGDVVESLDDISDIDQAFSDTDDDLRRESGSAHSSNRRGGTASVSISMGDIYTDKDASQVADSHITSVANPVHSDVSLGLSLKGM